MNPSRPSCAWRWGRAARLAIFLLCAVTCTSGPVSVKEKASTRDQKSADTSTPDAALTTSAAGRVATCAMGSEVADATWLDEPIILGACPDGTEPVTDKVWHAAYLNQHRGETQTVAVVLKERGLPEPCVSETICPAGADWETRSKLSTQQVGCVLDRLATNGLVEGLAGFWYDRLVVEGGHAVAPIGRIFRVTLSWDEVWTAAAHPYVARVEPVPGEQGQWQGQQAPPVPCDCPPLTDEAEPKLVGLELAKTGPTDKLQLAIYLTTVPALDPRLLDSDEGDFASFARAVTSTRQLFCVRRALDQIAASPVDPGALAAAMLLDATALPPFSDPAVVHQAFSASMTASEAAELAKHPFVDHLELLPESGSPSTTSTCPPNLDAPLLEPECTEEREGVEGKLSQVLLDARANACAEPYSVAVSVRGGATYCPLPECPAAPTTCPERDAWEQRWHEENLVSQTCLRQVLEILGGTVEQESTLSNTFYTHLDWQQIEALAAHPDVSQVNENEVPCGNFIPPP